MDDIKNVEFLAEVSQEFGKHYEIAVTCALGSFSLSLLSISSQYQLLSDRARVEIQDDFLI
jgi:hypothetical protein